MPPEKSRRHARFDRNSYWPESKQCQNMRNGQPVPMSEDLERGCAKQCHSTAAVDITLIRESGLLWRQSREIGNAGLA
jgi:hypothetical protein